MIATVQLGGIDLENGIVGEKHRAGWVLVSGTWLGNVAQTTVISEDEPLTLEGKDSSSKCFHPSFTSAACRESCCKQTGRIERCHFTPEPCVYPSPALFENRTCMYKQPEPRVHEGAVLARARGGRKPKPDKQQHLSVVVRSWWTGLMEAAAAHSTSRNTVWMECVCVCEPWI